MNQFVVNKMNSSRAFFHTCFVNSPFIYKTVKQEARLNLQTLYFLSTVLPCLCFFQQLQKMDDSRYEDRLKKKKKTGIADPSQMLLNHHFFLSFFC